jgi:hypothetical protein
LDILHAFFLGSVADFIKFAAERAETFVEPISFGAKFGQLGAQLRASKISSKSGCSRSSL